MKGKPSTGRYDSRVRECARRAARRAIRALERVAGSLGVIDARRAALRDVVRTSAHAGVPEQLIVARVAEEMYRHAIAAGAFETSAVDLGPWLYERDAEEVVATALPVARALHSERTAMPQHVPAIPRAAETAREGEGSRTGISPSSSLPFLRAKKRNAAPYVVALMIAALTVLAVHYLRPPSVAVIPVMRGTAVDAVYATGTVEAVDRVTVKAKSAGAVVELRVKEGARVEQGDLLAVIDARPLRAELARASADAWAAAEQATLNAPQLATLEAQGRVLSSELRQAREDSARLATLVTAGSSAATEHDRAQTRVAVLEAQLAANEAQRRALRIDLTSRARSTGAAVHSIEARLADAEVRAPLRGVVLTREVEPGEVVTLNQPLLGIGDTDRLVLECAIDEADVGKVAIGNKALVSLYAFRDRSYTGRVTEILPDADRAKKSFVVKVQLDAPPPRLRSGMTAEVNIVVEERDGVLLGAAEAVQPTGVAWAVVEGRARRRVVKTGVRDLVRVELTEGAREGDQLIVGAVDGLHEGMRVRATSPVDAASGARGPSHAAGAQ